MPVLRSHLTLPIPAPVGTGRPQFGYPFTWAIYRWLEGEVYEPESGAVERQLANDLAAFITQLRAIETAGAPESGRLPLPALDVATRQAIEAVGAVEAVGATEAVGDLDAARMADAWERSIEGPTWDGAPVWRHCDLLPPNLLVEGGRLHAILDFGGAGIGDPAADVIAAWTLFGQSGRQRLRQLLDVDEATWRRARGYALHQALLIIPYYAVSNPAFVTMARRTVREVLDDMAL